MPGDRAMRLLAGPKNNEAASSARITKILSNDLRGDDASSTCFLTARDEPGRLHPDTNTHRADEALKRQEECCELRRFRR